MGPHPGSERLDPGINLERRPDSLLPINVILNELAHDRNIVGLKDSENMGTSFGGPQGDKGVVWQLLLTLRKLRST